MALADLTLSHYSIAAVLEPRSVAQHRRLDKPFGLWVSVDGPDDWPAWCRAESFAEPWDQHHYRVELAADARIRLITSADELVVFHDLYARDMWDVDWVAVSRRYQGIMIAPYLWSMRLHDQVRWYYGWDCASGCIWDASAIARVYELEGVR